MGNKRKLRTAGGFTLVEMLMVIAIISLLVALLAPTLKNAMEASVVMECKDNHLKLVIAVQMYAMDFNNSLPWNNWASKDAAWKDSSGLAGWLYDYPMAEVPEEVETGSLWTYIGSREYYRCPRHKSPYGGSSEKLTSYAMNGAVSRYADEAQTGPYRIHQMPTNGICFWEVEASALGGGSWNDGSSLPSEGITARHGDGATVGCFGGQIQWISNSEYNTEEARDPGRLWCAPTSDGH